MARTHPLEPFHPNITLGRLAAGAIGGIVGGLLFGVMLLSSAVIGDADMQGRGILPLATELIGTSDPMMVWLVHSVMSVAAGLVFSVVVSPHSYRSSIIWALGYSMILWFVGSVLLLRSLTGTPIAYDPAAVYGQIGHLLYGLGLGIFYVGFHHEEVRDAHQASSAKWRAWADREEKEEGNSPP